jgi:hypothetical protein
MLFDAPAATLLPPALPRLGLMTILLFVLLASLAHAQPTKWPSPRQDFTTQGSDAEGGSGPGTSCQEGVTATSTPTARTVRCNELDSGTTHTDCLLIRCIHDGGDPGGSAHNRLTRLDSGR